MTFHTKKYDIRKIDPDGEFDDGIAYEICLKDGYVFSDGSGLNYAEDYDDLLSLIDDIKGVK